MSSHRGEGRRSYNRASDGKAGLRRDCVLANHRGEGRRSYDRSIGVQCRLGNQYQVGRIQITVPTGQGVVYRNQLYLWGDVRDIRRISRSGAAGSGILIFADGARCVVNLHTFRKQGEDSAVSFLGGNPVFERLRAQLVRKQLESLADPRLDELRVKLDALGHQLATAQGQGEVSRIGKQITQAKIEHSRLDSLYMEKLKRYEKNQSSAMVKLAVALTLLAIIGLIGWART